MIAWGVPVQLGVKDAEGLRLPEEQPEPPVVLKVMFRELPLVLHVELLFMLIKWIPLMLAVQRRGVCPNATSVPFDVPERTVK